MGTCSFRAAAGISLLLLLVISPAMAAEARRRSAAGAPRPLALADRLAGMAKKFEKSHRSIVGLSAVDAATGKVLATHRDGELFMPASNMKLLSSAFALARLGGDFKFRTTVYLAGNDLVIVGDFDPTLGDPVVAQADGTTIYDELDAWAGVVKRMFPTQALGDVIIVSRGQPGDYRPPDWPQDKFGHWYCAPVAELNFNNNCIDVTFASHGGALSAVLSPASSFIRISNGFKSGSKAAWWLRDNKDGSVVTITGTATRSPVPCSSPISNPPMLLGRTFADRLVKAGVKFSGTIRQVTPDKVDLAKAKAIAQTATPLAMAISRSNKRSLNMAAECLFLRSGDGTWGGSAKIAQETLAKAYGLADGSVVASDGSGFSRKNRVSPDAMTRMLGGMLKGKDAKILLDSLPVGGIDGSLSKRFKGAGKGRVLGKTGFINGVSCLSGYVLDKTGRPAVIYSVLVNKVTNLSAAKSLEEQVCEILLADLDARSK